VLTNSRTVLLPGRYRGPYEAAERGPKARATAGKACFSTLLAPAQEQAFADAGAYLEDVVGLWSKMTLEENVRAPRAMLDAVYVDVTEKRIAEIKARAAFIPVLRLCDQALIAIDEDGEPLVHGDPEGIRTSSKMPPDLRDPRIRRWAMTIVPTSSCPDKQCLCSDAR